MRVLNIAFLAAVAGAIALAAPTAANAAKSKGGKTAMSTVASSTKARTVVTSVRWIGPPGAVKRR